MVAGGQAGRRMPGGQAGRGLEAIVPNPKLKLLDQVREVMRLRHYSIRTEHCYCDWIRRYVKFHQMRCREDLNGGTGKVEMFLSDLAVNGQVAASTQNQAFNALLFLYRDVLHLPFENVQAVRADRPQRVPVVLTVRLSLSARRFRPKVPSCGAGMELAICISCAGFVLGSALRANSPAPPGRGDNPQGDQSGDRAGGNCRARQQSHLSSQF